MKLRDIEEYLNNLPLMYKKMDDMEILKFRLKGGC